MGTRLTEIIYYLLPDQVKEIIQREKYLAFCISSDVIILVGTCKNTNRLFFEANFERLADLEDYILTKI